MPPADAPRIKPDDADGWRGWLTENHAVAPGVWLVYRKKGHEPNLVWPAAVDQALCFGWIDSRVEAIDEARYEQWFCPRKPGSVWSRINKAKVEVLIDGGLMTPAGFAAIEVAKANGSWTILDGPEALEIPEDLKAAMAASPGTLERFRGNPPSTQRNALQWLVLAKREATRRARITAILQRLANGRPPF